MALFYPVGEVLCYLSRIFSGNWGGVRVLPREEPGLAFCTGCAPTGPIVGWNSGLTVVASRTVLWAEPEGDALVAALTGTAGGAVPFPCGPDLLLAPAWPALEAGICFAGVGAIGSVAERLAFVVGGALPVVGRLRF